VINSSIILLTYVSLSRILSSIAFMIAKIDGFTSLSGLTECQALGGTAWAESTVGEGTKIIADVPGFEGGELEKAS